VGWRRKAREEQTGNDRAGKQDRGVEQHKRRRKTARVAAWSNSSEAHRSGATRAHDRNVDRTHGVRDARADPHRLHTPRPRRAARAPAPNRPSDESHLSSRRREPRPARREFHYARKNTGRRAARQSCARRRRASSAQKLEPSAQLRRARESTPRLSPPSNPRRSSVSGEGHSAHSPQGRCDARAPGGVLPLERPPRARSTLLAGTRPNFSKSEPHAEEADTRARRGEPGRAPPRDAAGRRCLETTARRAVSSSEGYQTPSCSNQWVVEDQGASLLEGFETALIDRGGRYEARAGPAEEGTNAKQWSAEGRSLPGDFEFEDGKWLSEQAKALAQTISAGR